MSRYTNRRRLFTLLSIAGLGLSASVTISTPAFAQEAAVNRRVAADSGADRVPIRKITLYRSGVGYFERAGRITGDTEIQLRFNTDQINDILKSMVLIDKGGGRIDAVSYGSKEPLSRRLASFGVDISANPSIPDLLDQLRGAPVRVFAGEEAQGTILGVEQRQVATPKDQSTRTESFLNLVTPTGLRSIAISGISSFEILDKELADELNKALAALAEYRADRTKTVDLHFSGEGARDSGARDVVVGYIHEMPVWKPSYRLILPDESAGATPRDKATSSPTASIQGWAIVENNTDQDWDDVRLSLVSGRPVSFQMDLYEPLYVARPLIPVPTIPGVAPRAYQGGSGQSPFDGSSDMVLAEAGQSELAESRSKAGVPPASPAPVIAGVPMTATRGRYQSVSAADMDSYAARGQATAAEIGEVFQYELDAPVTIERQRSAMIPILTASIAGRRVSIFNLADGSEHPMRGVEITNDSDLQLLPGPIAVFDGNDGTSAYAGDAQIGHVGQGDKRLLAYAVDLDVKVQTESSANANITRLRIVQGSLEQTVKSDNRTAYAFKNADEKRPRTVVVEHTKLPGWTLAQPEKPSDETTNLYRFEMVIPPAKSHAITITQERVESQHVAVTHYDLPTILQFHRDGKLSQQVVDAFKEVARQQAEIAQAERQAQDLDRQIAEINQDQARIRENMNRIDHASQLYTRYMTKLTEQETTLENLAEQRKKAQATVSERRNDLNNYIRSLNIE